MADLFKKRRNVTDRQTRQIDRQADETIHIRQTDKADRTRKTANDKPDKTDRQAGRQAGRQADNTDKTA
jgi:hypothetical protein